MRLVVSIKSTPSPPAVSLYRTADFFSWRGLDDQYMHSAHGAANVLCYALFRQALIERVSLPNLARNLPLRPINCPLAPLATACGAGYPYHNPGPICVRLLQNCRSASEHLCISRTFR